VRKIDLNNFKVASSATARDINRRTILNLVRKHQPVSQADLMRLSGFQRSTVSVITGQLIETGWLREGALGKLPRGRKPTNLHLNENRAGIFGIDIRVQKTRYALANLEGRFLVSESMATPASPIEFVDRMGGHIRALIKAHPQLSYEGIGVSLPGRVDLSSHKFAFAPNLHWSAVDLKALLEQKTGLPVELENAANACALSEYWFGRQFEGIHDLFAVTVSEGIGVGMILNGQLVRGISGLAGEFGHVSLNDDGPLCACGNNGCWEVYASNSAAIRYYNAKIRPRGRAVNGNKSPAFEDILQLAEQGDLKALEALDQMANHLGRGIAMLITGLAPEAIVVVGEVTRVWDRVGPIVNRVVKQRASTHASARILTSSSVEQPRLRGIIALVLQKYFEAPATA
jgi:predicted NBD/HSP70 family sugar kinase